MQDHKRSHLVLGEGATHVLLFLLIVLLVWLLMAPFPLLFLFLYLCLCVECVGDGSLNEW